MGKDFRGDGELPLAVDYFSYLEAWVDRGRSPEKVVGYHATPEGLKFYPTTDTWELIWGREFSLDPSITAFSQAICPYPIDTKYLGHGDPRNAASFGPYLRAEMDGGFPTPKRRTMTSRIRARGMDR